MQGSLSAGSFAAALRDLHLGRETGLLHCAQPGALRSLRFRRGEVIHVLSDQKDERLGETLLRLGVISGEQLTRATFVLVSERKRLGPVLIELGVLSFGQLQEALGRHIRDVFERVLSKLEGQLVFEAIHDDDSRPDEARPLLQTADLVLQATRRMPPAEVTAALGDLTRPLALGPGAGMLAAALRLSPSEGFLLSRIDGSTARDALSLLPGDPAEAECSLLGLIACGIAAWGPARSAPVARADDRPRVTRMPVVEGRAQEPVAAAAGASPAPAAGSSAVPRAGSAPAPSAAVPAAPKPGPAAAPPAPPAPPAAPDPEATKREKQAELRKAIEEAHAALGNENHFEVLGLTRSATEAELKEAYFRLAKRFHPDSCNDDALADLKPKAEQLFIRIGKAWDVMRNPKARADYEANLPRSRPAAPAAAPVAPVAPPTPRTQALAAEVEVARANDSVRKAEKLAQEEKYWDAIQLFEAALPIATGNYPLRAHLGLARCYMKNPNWARRGEEQLHKAAQDFPKSAEPPFELARLYRDRGMKARALGQLRKVLELQPEHEEATAMLADLDGGPRTDPESPPGGLLGKLLGRK